mgnify:CR=1 FL=1
MKILHINPWDVESRGVYHLHSALKEAQMESRMLVQYKSSYDPSVLGMEKKREKCALLFQDNISKMLLKSYKKKAPFSTAWVSFGKTLRKIQEMCPDIVHIHSFCNMLKIEELPKIQQPVVWSLYDMWPLTGGCYNPCNDDHPTEEECKKYTKSCGCCPALGSFKEKDISYKVWERKRIAFGQMKNLTLVAISETISQAAKESQLFSGREVLSIPYPVDTNVFQNIDKKVAREILGLPLEKKLLLVHSRKSQYDNAKALSLLWEALQDLQMKKMELIFLGPIPDNPGRLPVQFLGNWQDDVSRKLLYNAVDVFVEPFYQEVYSYSILESLACATPVVAFRTPHTAEILQHAQNGYLAKALDSKDMAAGIDWLCHHLNYKHLSIKAREKALESFEKTKILKEYINLYEKLVC